MRSFHVWRAWKDDINLSIILPKTDYDTAVSTAHKICERISSRTFKLPNNRETSVTISLGVSSYPVDGETTADQVFVSEPSTAILPSNEVLPPVGSSNETTSA